MFFEFIVVGSALFWALLIALLILCEWTTTTESHSGLVFVLAFCGILATCSSFNPFVWVFHNFWTSVIFAALYVLVGAVWGFAKWWFHLKNVKDGFTVDFLARKKESYQSDVTKLNFKGTFTDWLQSNGYIPIALKNKELISVWMFWWPFSMFWTALHDVLKRFYNWVITKYINVFARINNAVFGSLNN